MSEAVIPMPEPTAANSEENSEHATRFQAGNPYRFRRGTSGNPAGRPKVTPVSAELEALLLEPLPDTAEGKRIRKRFGLKKGATWAEAIAHAAVRRALRSTETLREITDRVEGKVTQKVELGGTDAITIRVVYEDEPPPKD
jgi:hypothetical protein